MPVGTVDPSLSERFELKSAPADPNVEGDEAGFVVLRPLPYGLKLRRRDKMSRMSMKAETKKDGKAEGGEMVIESFNEWAVGFDMQYCILDHNLTDKNGQKLDFKNELHRRMLNPKIGSEIEKLINSLNEDDDGDMEDFRLPSSTLLTTDTSDLEFMELPSETPTATL